MSPLHERFWLWVDGVGGYLVCAADSVALGQPGLEGADVPILADLSRRHAVVRRIEESYLVEPLRETRLDGEAIVRPTVLKRRATIELGSAVRMLFELPHPLSLSARLSLVSRHRTMPLADGIVLAHQTIVLGGSSRSHIVCPGWRHELILMRRGEEWSCACRGVAISVSGVTSDRPLPLSSDSRIVGPDFSISLEPDSKLSFPAANERT